MNDNHSALLQRCLDRLQAGDEAARAELLTGVCTRLRQLTHVMLRDYRRLKRWQETDDVLQSALLRLHRALEGVTPPSPRDFYRLATLQIRRELIDLARHFYGPAGRAKKHETNAGRGDASAAGRRANDPADPASGPSQLASWGEFHEQAQGLPAEEQEVFGLIWYQGLTHAEAAELLGVAVKTVQRRWHAACRRLHKATGGELPGRA